jgi:hypothetical protein
MPHRLVKIRDLSRLGNGEKKLVKPKVAQQPSERALYQSVMSNNSLIAKFRAMPACRALATGIAAVEICTALFDAIWRVFFDIDIKILGPGASIGVYIFIPLALFLLIIIAIIIFGMCAFRCDICAATYGGNGY